MDPIVLEYNTFRIGDAFTRALFSFFGGEGDYVAFTANLYSWWQAYSIVAFLISGLFLLGIVYSKIRFTQVYDLMMEDIYAEERAYGEQKSGASKNAKWQDVLTHAESDNPNDWRLAIIEADIILDGLLETQGLPGDTIGDRLKSANKTTFQTLGDAWEAHKIRNEIAHRGGDYILTKRTVHDTLQRYQRVFSEFGIV